MVAGADAGVTLSEAVTTAMVAKLVAYGSESVTCCPENQSSTVIVQRMGSLAGSIGPRSYSWSCSPLLA